MDAMLAVAIATLLTTVKYILDIEWQDRKSHGSELKQIQMTVTKRPFAVPCLSKGCYRNTVILDPHQDNQVGKCLFCKASHTINFMPDVDKMRILVTLMPEVKEYKEVKEDNLSWPLPITG